ncbi:MAG: hypothetical protein ACRYGG_12240 [Janthinobacterium lividum]
MATKKIVGAPKGGKTKNMNVFPVRKGTGANVQKTFPGSSKAPKNGTPKGK